MKRRLTADLVTELNEAFTNIRCAVALTIAPELDVANILRGSERLTAYAEATMLHEIATSLAASHKRLIAQARAAHTDPGIIAEHESYLKDITELMDAYTPREPIR